MNIHKGSNDLSDRIKPDRIIQAGRIKLEEEIASLEQELLDITVRLEKHELDPEEATRLNESYTDINNTLDALIKEWEEYPPSN